MTLAFLTEQILAKKTFLCVGLDPDLDKLPKHLLTEPDPVFAFNKAIIDATAHYSVAYKPNLAFYEVLGTKGWTSLEKTINYLNTKYPNHFTIADAKRGDIGNTSRMYAKTFFEGLNFDSVTVAPYMGRDSVESFLEFKEKYTILLALTSNDGASDFQLNKGDDLFEKVIETSKKWKNAENLMYVVGATQTAHLKRVRELIPDSFLLIPGVGAQGGSLEEVCRFGMNKNIGLLVNSSRGIIYQSGGSDFAEKAAEEAQKIQCEMAFYLEKFHP
jgi:orotidine-5'-phosphate decarboxylase